MSQPMTWAPGATVPGTVYRIIRPLGSGGMGDVYEAEHAMLGVRRALKVLNRRMAARSDLAERMRVEARALAAIAHPNLVQVLDLGISTDGRMFFAMELLEGATLRDVIARQGRLAPEHAAAIAAGVLEGLAAAHERGLVHRDVKPENVFVTRTGAIKVLDFGIAKTLAGGDMSVHHLTATGMAVGTPRYMAPEQSQGQPVDARADVYSVGVLLWEMLAGRPPFHDLEAIAAAVAAVTRGVPSLEESGVHVTPALSAIVRRATAREAADRFPSAAAMRAELTGTDPRGGTLRMDAVPTGPGMLAALVASSTDRVSRMSTPGDAAMAVAPTELHTTPSGANSSVRGGTAPLDVRGLPTPTSAPAPAAGSSANAATPPPVAATTSSAGAPSAGRGLGLVWMVAPIVLGALALGAWIALRAPATAPQDATASAAPPPAQSAPPQSAPPGSQGSATAAATPPPTTSSSAAAAVQATTTPTRGATEPPRPVAGKTGGKTAAAQAAPPGPAPQPEPAPAPAPAAPKAKPGGLPSSGLD